MQARLRSRWACVSCLALLPAFGCGLDDPLPGPDGALEDAGSVGLQLKVGDVTLTSVSYVITGNGYAKIGAIDVSGSSTISALIGGIPAGNGYSITLSATDANSPPMQCAASASFNITARATTISAIRLLCHLPSNNGSVQLEGSTNVCPRIDALTVEPSEVTVGGTMALGSSVTDSDALPVPATYAWSANGGNLTGASLAQASFECTAPGTFQVSLLVSDTACSDSATATVTCSPDDGVSTPRPDVRINEVESSLGVPGDWTELYNADSVAADISGWVFKDNDDTHVYTIPAGTVIPPGGYFVVEEAAQNFGLGSADSARLFDAAGELVDSYSWTAHAANTYGRCPSGSGGFVSLAASSKGAENGCAPVGP